MGLGKVVGGVTERPMVTVLKSVWQSISMRRYAQIRTNVPLPSLRPARDVLSYDGMSRLFR